MMAGAFSCFALVIVLLLLQTCFDLIANTPTALVVTLTLQHVRPHVVGP